MDSVFKFLWRVELRPEMYVGGEPGDRRQQLKNLELLLWGYETALVDHHLAGAEPRFSQAFGAYLYERLDWSGSAGPIAAVLHEAKPGEEWSTFWYLVHEFEAAPANRGAS